MSRRILQVNAADRGGGAEVVTMDLQRGYLERGWDAWVAVGKRDTEDERVLEIPNAASRSWWTRSVAAGADLDRDGAIDRSVLVASDPARYRRILAGREDYGFPATRDILQLPPERPDILQLHNLHGYYFDLRQLPGLSADQPTIITMHDAWLVTGHCAHPFDCPNYRTGCGACPDLSRYVPISRDASAANQSEKLDILRRSNVRLATPSEWLMRIVQESGAGELARETRVIPNGVDERLFSPGDRAAARTTLDLPLDRPIVLVAANAVKANPFKDYPTLLAALPVLAERHPETLVIAVGGPDEELDHAGLEVRHAPFIADRAEMARYYRAADVYAHPARAENLPLAVIEALASGTPTVASDVGGIPEIVVDDRTGSLVPAEDPAALAHAVARVLDDAETRQRFAAAGRERVVERFTLDRQADAYVAWFEELLAEGR